MPSTAPITSTFKTMHINTEPTWRGGEQQTLYLVEGLAKRGYPVLLCAQKGSPLVDRARAKGIETVGLRMRGEIDPVAAWRVAGEIRRFRPELLHYHTSHAHGLGAMAVRLVGRGRPRTLLTRRVDFSIYRHSFFGLNHLKYKQVDRIVAISKAVEQVLRADGIAAERIDRVASGVDPERFDSAARADLHSEFSLPPHTKLIGNTAFFADHKGQRYLIEAAIDVLAAYPDCAIFLIGDGSLRRPLMSLAKELGVADRVLFPGFRTDIPAILKALDIYVMPSHAEGLGTAILDALCCSRPVIAADAGGIPEIIQHEHSGLLVPPRDSKALSKAILRLLESPEEALGYGAAGLHIVQQNYTVDKMVEGNLDVYRRLLGYS